MSTSRAGAAVLVALAMVSAACGPFRMGRSPEPALLVFHNDALDQVTVYITASGQDFRRIGTVFPGRTDTLRVPADMVTRGTINVVASVFAKNMVPSTGPVSVAPGDVYEVRLSADGRMLSVLPGS